MNSLKTFFIILVAAIGGNVLTGCAGVNWATVATDVVQDVKTGAIAAQDAYTAYQALNQSLTTANVTTGKLSVAKVFAAAQAGSTALNTAGLSTAVTDLVTNAQQTINDLKAQGASTPAIIAAASNQGASAITTVAAIAPTVPTASNGWKKHTENVCLMEPGEAARLYAVDQSIIKATSLHIYFE